ncbi:MULTISPECIES: type II toxin-antitoxin system YhaV family toxin [unclassified Aureimonas]|uniref:type II toxin-antitoxin system YhaV family toxin n=1 Tax=unclassified Aureimonas TaxID=2615206 RepID=UPI0006FE1982|nr:MULTISPECIES: type II toxin-antitoxin system YhaV family toxin [unclassified Aureimonas]KQT65119.1 toxin [Aureimonas sp. Leaf427]KQT76231.1 toxin [Aureimonas sp. Leaf460]
MSGTPEPAKAPLVVNGWSIYAHPVFLDQIEALAEEVAAHRSRDPSTYRTKASAKRLAAILKLVTQDIPADPAAPKFRQGDTLGSGRKHWFRAKSFQQYRLFFRFDSASRIIVLAWVNDDATLRAYGSRADAYAVFKAMLDDGHPPEDFDALLNAAQSSNVRLATAVGITDR